MGSVVIDNIPQEEVKKETSSGKKVWRVIKIILCIILVILLLCVGFYFGCIIYEKSKLSSYNYGQKIDVNGHQMNVIISGEKNNETIVFVNGFVVPSPYIHYRPFTEELSKEYKVVSLEPFGYGLSDIVDEERTIDNIATELHTALQSLKINKYYLMGHSLGGAYTHYFTNKYPNEVIGHIGFDITTPIEPLKGTDEFIKQVSINKERWNSLFDVNKLTVPLSPNHYTDEERTMWRIMTLQKGYNKNILSEAIHVEDNVNLASKKFPKETKVLNFMSSEYATGLPNFNTTLLDYGSESKVNAILEVPGGHVSIFLDEKETILKKIKSFISL